MSRLSLVALIFLAMAAAPAQEEGTGLAATFYNNVDFTGHSVSRIDPVIDFSWRNENASPADGIGPEFWSAIWVGAIAIPVTGSYTFTTRSDDGIIVTIDDQVIIDNWTGHSPTIDVGSIELTAGLHPVTIRYFNGHFTGVLQWWWQSEQIAKEIVPSRVLFPVIPPAHVGSGTGLTATYFDHADFRGLSVVREDPTIAFDWGHNAPAPGIDGATFSVEWRGWLEPQYTDTYQFFSEANDGFALSLDGEVVIDRLHSTLRREATGSRALIGGRRYEVTARFRQVGGAAKATLRWSSPLTPKQVIPTSQWYPYDAATAADVTLEGGEESPSGHLRLHTWTNPAWVTGTRGSGATTVAASLAGQDLVIIAEQRDRWFATVPGREQVAPGVPVVPGDNPLVITGPGGRQDVTIHWATIDLANLDYGLERLVARPGDRVLVAVGGQGVNASVSVVRDNAIVSSATDEPGVAHVLAFDEPGVYRVDGTIDDRPIGTVTVIVPAVDLRGPIACEIGFRRSKQVEVAHVAEGIVTFIANDAALLQIGGDSATGALTLRPLASGSPALQARIGGPSGPVLAWCPIDAFTIATSAERSIDVIERFPDGSLLTQATLTMDPLVPDLSVLLKMYTGGTTFIDGTTRKTIPSNAFIAARGISGTYLYHIIRGPRSNTTLCHTTQVYQDGVLIANH